MAGGRSMWKGALKVGLVTVPVRMVAATEKAEKYSFNRLHDRCKGRLKSKSWCPTCSVEVQSEQSLRGYEHRKGEYVVISDAELDACETETSHTLDVTTVTSDRVSPLHIDSTAYMVPDGPAAVHAFETLRVALADRLAVGGMVLRKKAWQVALASAPNGFIVYMLRGAAQVKDLADVEREAAFDPPKQDVALARQLLAALEGSFSYEGVHDEYTAAVKELIEAKVDGRAPTVAAPRAANVSSLADALRASLDAATAKPKRAAKATMKEAPAARRKAG